MSVILGEVHGRVRIAEMSRSALHVVHSDKVETAINRAHTLFHSILISLFLYHRINDVVSTAPPLLPSLLLFLAELILAFLWLSEQAFRWTPVRRTVFIGNLPDESKLLAIDVFICTADPDKEPTVEVMNTVVSAMALDYPSDKLHVYLSDDAGSAVTLAAIKEAWGFATWWVPFCTRYGIKCRCPMSFFQLHIDAELSGADFVREILLLKEKYELFKQRVQLQLLLHRGVDKNNKVHHPPLVQVINDTCTNPSLINPNISNIPLLIYVAREKRPCHPHNFKAGALNVLLRVSGMLSNSPVVLVLDCDMYCNDPTSAKQAMCFYVDPNISSSLGFVQFPQRFHNLSKHAIYDGDFRWASTVLFPGMDGLGTGPIMCGTGFYLNRRAMYSGCVNGSSSELIKSLSEDIEPNKTKLVDITQKILPEATVMASCEYEEETEWGNGVGFYYYSVVEDVFTGYNLHIRGWKSVYLNPERPSFLGTSTTNLNDLLTQFTRWTAGLVEVGLSRFSPWFYDQSTTHLSFLHRTCYAYIDLFHISFISVWCLAVVPQLCLLHGIPIYSKISSSMFPWLATFIFLSSQMKHFYEVRATGLTIATWWNEQEMWILKMLTCQTYGFLDAVMKVLGVKNTSFVPTNKVVDEDQVKRYQQGIYDFQTSNMFLVPLGTTVILNLVCFIMGSVRIMVVGNWEEMAVQGILSGFFVVMSKPVIEGMFVRKDKGRFATSSTLKSIVACLVIIVLGPSILFT